MRGGGNYLQLASVLCLLPNLQHKRSHYCCSGKEKDKLASDQDLLQATGKLVQQHWLETFFYILIPRESKKSFNDDEKCSEALSTPPGQPEQPG